MSDPALVNRVWNDAHGLRRRGIPFGDDIEQINYLLFLEPDEEREALLGEDSTNPASHRATRTRRESRSIRSPG